MSTTAISVANVRKAFDSLVAVDDVSLEVQRGEVFGLLGPNGAGKTTLIRMVMDIIKPDAGVIEVLGHHLTDEAKTHIGYLPEERGLYARQKVLQVLEYFACLKGLDRQPAHRKALAWLERLDMLDVKEKKVGELSKGNQQKIQLLVTFVSDPEIVILDEPFSGLDPINARTVSTLIREQAEAGKTVLLSAHQMGLVETLCGRVFMINKGKRVLYGHLDQIKRQYSDNAVLVRTTADYGRCDLIDHYVAENGAAKVFLREGVRPRDFLAWLLNQGADVESFEQATTPLEDIFIKLVQEHR